MNSSEPQPTPAVSALRKFLYVLQGRTAWLFIMVGLFILLSAMDVLGVGLIGPFVAAVIDPSRLGRVPHLSSWLAAAGSPLHLAPVPALGALLLVVFAVKGAVAYRLHHRVLAFAFDVRAHLIKRLMRSYLRMPLQFYLDRNSSTLVQAVVHNTKVMTDDLLIPIMRSISDAVVLLLIGAFLFIVNPAVMAAFCVVMLVTFAGYARIVRPRTRAAGEQVAVANERIIRGVNQIVSGIKDIRILGLRAYFLRLIEGAADANTVAQVRFNSFLVMPRYLMETVVVLFILALTLVTLTRGAAPADLVAMLAMFAAAGLRALPALSQVSASFASMHYSSFALTSLYADLRLIETLRVAGPEEEINPAAEPVATSERPRAFQEIELRQVSFTYPNAAFPAIEDVDLLIRQGSSVGLIGESGAGKTTLVDLLLGLHRVDRGTVLMDGVDLNSVGWERWTSLIAYIPQFVFITDDTLRRNIALGVEDEEIDAERIEEALNLAQLSGFVARLPLGLDTLLGECGGRISGGERQRIALARAFYHNRDVLVFDEATSALDSETEREVVRVIDSLRGLKTVIVIAHRLSTVRSCEVVHRLQRGRLIKSGRLEEVAGV
jgi:ATP-binding cassette, subfamily B, bacterial PglK